MRGRLGQCKPGHDAVTDDPVASSLMILHTCMHVALMLIVCDSTMQPPTQPTDSGNHFFLWQNRVVFSLWLQNHPFSAKTVGTPLQALPKGRPLVVVSTKLVELAPRNMARIIEKVSFGTPLDGGQKLPTWL